MGDNRQTTTTQSGPSNPAVDATTTKLLTKLQGAVDTGVPVFGESLFAGAGDTTKAGWGKMLGAADNPAYASGVSGAISSFGDTAAGNKFGMNDPGYAQVRQNAIDDTMTNVNGVFSGSGRFGGGSHVKSLGEGVSKTIAGLDYANNQNDIARQERAAALMPGLFTAGTLPATAYGAVGGAQDANAQGVLQGRNDLYQRKNGAIWDTLGRASSILAGTAGSSGTTSTTTQPSTPWWQSALGFGLGAAGAFL